MTPAATHDGPTTVATPVGIARGSRYLVELECLRGVAIALVVLFHADGLVRFPFGNTVGMWPSLPLALVLGGHTGVSLFFVLSGFLLALPFLAEAEGAAASIGGRTPASGCCGSSPSTGRCLRSPWW